MAQPGLAKSLPHSPDAERAILGAILLDNSQIKKAAEKLTAGDFFAPQGGSSENRLIFSTMIELEAEGTALDTITMCDRLAKHGKLESAGGPAYLESLQDGMPKIVHIEHYIKIVKEQSHRRSIIHGTELIQSQAWKEFSAPRSWPKT